MPSFPARRALLYFHTLRHLRPVQWYGRLWQKLAAYLPVPPRPLRVDIDAPEETWHVPPVRHPVWLGGHRLGLLGAIVETDHPRVWAGEGLSALQRYNLHYFEELGGELTPEAMAYYRPVIADWIAGNPPAVGVGWSAYPLSRRVVNWIKADLSHRLLDQIARASLYQQVGYLLPRLEIHLQGNHLWCNAKALVFAGLYFGARRHDPEPLRWFRKGMALLIREFREQVRTDGSHYEQTAMYQALAVEDLLDLINVLSAYQEDVPAEWWRGLRDMLRFNRAFVHADGAPVGFNDAVAGIAPSADELAAYADRLRPGMSSASGAAGVFPDAGWARMAEGAWTVFFDAGPIGPDHLPAHAHADSLTIEIDWSGTRLLVDTGSGEYGSGAARQQQRGTRAHNTVLIDGVDSSEVWGGFRVARRARILEPLTCLSMAGGTRCSAAHDGYLRLSSPVIHFREIDVSTRRVVVRDRLQGNHNHACVWNWHLGPEIHVDTVDESGILLRVPGGGDDKLICVQARFLEMKDTQTSAPAMAVEEFIWWPAFGRGVNSSVIRVAWLGPLPVTLETTFSELPTL